MIETTFWSERLRPKLVAACRANYLAHHFQRVENAVATGTPDVDYCIAGTAGKIELKYSPHHPVRPDTPVLGRGEGLRRSQVIFAYRRIRAGGRVYLGIGTPSATWFIDLRTVDHKEMGVLEMYSAPRLREISAWCDFSGDWATLPLALIGKTLVGVRKQ